MNFAGYKDIIKRLAQSKVPIKGTPVIFYPNFIRVELDITRTPRAGKVRKWVDSIPGLHLYAWKGNAGYPRYILVEMKS